MVRIILDDDKRYVRNEQVITKTLPSDIYDWMISNTNYVMPKSPKIDKNKLPSYKKKIMLSDIFAICAFLGLALMVFCMVRAVQIPNGTDKSNLATGVVIGLVIFLSALIISLIVKQSLVERHLKKKCNVLDTHILKDGRIAVIKYFYDKDFQPPLALIRTCEKNERRTTETSFCNYLYINIYNSVNEFCEVSDGIAVNWSGEKYFVWARQAGKNGSGVVKYYTFYKFDVNGAKEIFPNIYENLDYLKQALAGLKK